MKIFGFLIELTLEFELKTKGQFLTLDGCHPGTCPNENRLPRTKCAQAPAVSIDL